MSKPRAVSHPPMDDIMDESISRPMVLVGVPMDRSWHAHLLRSAIGGHDYDPQMDNSASIDLGVGETPNDNEYHMPTPKVVDGPHRTRNSILKTRLTTLHK